MGREVRKVPNGWEHPLDDNGYPIPLIDGPYSIALASWEEGKSQWSRGFRKDYIRGGFKPRTWNETDIPFTEWCGERPDPDDYMPEWPEGEATHLMMYETCSEGTPLSPAFETPEELARWLVDNEASAFATSTASYEGWLRVCRGGFAPSCAVSSAGIINGVDAINHTAKHKEDV